MTRQLARKKRVLVVVQTVVMMLQMILAVCTAMCAHLTLINERRVRRPIPVNRLWTRMSFLYGLIFDSDVKCLSQLRMDRQTFTKLCNMLREEGGLVGSTNVSPEEMLAMFLYILAHHMKNWVIGFNFTRSGRTISKSFHECLKAMIRCQKNFWKTPEPVMEDSMDPKWKWFKVHLNY